jgi:hypothetical protein
MHGALAVLLTCCTTGMFSVDTGLHVLNGCNQDRRFPRRILEVNIGTPVMLVPV